MVHSITKSQTRLNRLSMHAYRGFSGGWVVKNSPANAGNMGLIPGLGRSPEGGNGNSLQRSFLENPMDRETQWATVHGGSKESDTTQCKATMTAKAF